MLSREMAAVLLAVPHQAFSLRYSLDKWSLGIELHNLVIFGVCTSETEQFVTLAPTENLFQSAISA